MTRRAPRWLRRAWACVRRWLCPRPRRFVRLELRLRRVEPPFERIELRLRRV